MKITRLFSHLVSSLELRRSFLVRLAMLPQKASRYESLAAIHASIRPLPRVIPKMQDQRSPLRESPPTLGTTVRFFPRVHPPMNTQVLLARELFVAHVALGHLLVDVTPPVHRQPSAGGEHGAAEIAQMTRFLAQSVQLAQMGFQESFPGESLEADRAHVFPFRAALHLGRQNIGVTGPHVMGQVLLVRIGFGAVVATIHLLSRVHVHVLHVLRPQEESLLTLAASERVIFGVPPSMTLEIRLLVRSVVAQVAGEPLRACVDQLVAGYVHRAPERFAALVAAERPVDVVQVLQMLDQFSRVAETGPAFDAFVNRSRGYSSRPENRGVDEEHV